MKPSPLTMMIMQALLEGVAIYANKSQAGVDANTDNDQKTVRVGKTDEDSNIKFHVMTMEEFFKMLSEDKDLPEVESGPMPHWAARPVDPQNLCRMTQLVTKDGHKTGNGVLFDITFCMLCDQTKFSVITDACNIIHLTFGELQELFHMPQWVMKDFPHQSMEDAVGEYFNNMIEN